MKSRMYAPTLRMQLIAVATLLAFSLAFIIPNDAAAQNNPVQNATNNVLVTGTTAAGDVFNGVLKVTNVAANTATGALTASGTMETLNKLARLRGRKGSAMPIRTFGSLFALPPASGGSLVI